VKTSVGKERQNTSVASVQWRSRVPSRFSVLVNVMHCCEFVGRHAARCIGGSWVAALDR
jgi:hypothetical protein